MSGGGHGHGGGKRRGHEEEHEEHENHERWLVSYADMMTLLMVLFIVLFAISQVDSKKFAALKTGLASGFGSPVAFLAGGDALLDVGGSVAPDSVNLPGQAGNSESTTSSGSASSDASVNAEAVAQLAAATSKSQVAQEVSNLQKAEQEIQEALDKAGEKDKATFRFNERGLVVTIATDQVLFASGSASLTAEGTKILNTIAPTLESLPNNLSIDGHTNSIPISTAQFPSNWELSTTRATNVLRHLHSTDAIAYGRMSATGYADTEPLVPGSSAKANAANRRVEIIVLARVDNSQGQAVESLGNGSTGAQPIGSQPLTATEPGGGTSSGSGASGGSRDAFIKGAANAGKQLSR